MTTKHKYCHDKTSVPMATLALLWQHLCLQLLMKQPFLGAEITSGAQGAMTLTTISSVLSDIPPSSTKTWTPGENTHLNSFCFPSSPVHKSSKNFESETYNDNSNGENLKWNLLFLSIVVSITIQYTVYTYQKCEPGKWNKRYIFMILGLKHDSGV